MGIAERREREREEVRRKILDAARDLFARDGYERVTMRAVADAIEYSPTAIYHHFEDKDDLVHALCEEDFGTLLRSLSGQAMPSDPLLRIRVHPVSVGTIYNCNLIIGADGSLLGRHRKLVPTWAEKLTWAGGDGASIRVYDTPVGPLGTLACGENTNTLARFALLSQGELVHVANYIALPVAPASYNMAEAIKIRATAHSFEGKVLTIVAC